MPVIRKSEGQRHAEAEVKDFHDDLGPFVVAAEQTRMAMVFTDAKADGNPIIFANDSFLALTRYERDEVLGQNFNFMMATADADARALIQQEFEGETPEGSEIRYQRKDGRDFWATVFISPVRDKAGEIVQHFASFADVTRYKQEMTQSKMLIDELNHRVKNTLATVQSIVFQALRTATEPKSIHEAIESRLLALSRSHDLLTREDWKSAGLRDIIKDALEPFEGSGAHDRIVLRGGNVRFAPKATLALGIAFNELATNAAKYGALSAEAGTVEINWILDTASGDRRLKLTWREKDGPPVASPTRTGFGTRVIERGLAYELQGQASLDYRKDGLVFTMDIPAPKESYHD